MPKPRQKHFFGSLQIGEVVEFIGRDKKNRGFGVVMRQCEHDPVMCYVFWQSIGEEYCHKGYLRRSIDITKGTIKK